MDQVIDGGFGCERLKSGRRLGVIETIEKGICAGIARAERAQIEIVLDEGNEPTGFVEVMRDVTVLRIR